MKEVPVFRQRSILELSSSRIRNLGVEVYYEYLMQLTKELGMHVIIPPVIVKIPVEDAVNPRLAEAEYGISAIMVWLESGVQIHTWPEWDFISIDVYSCKQYDPVTVLDVSNRFFRPEEIIRFVTI